MREYITLGPTPCEEACAQVGSDNYSIDSDHECRRYIQLLIKLFPDTPEYYNSHMTFTKKGFPHDFGTYHEVVVWYDTDNEESVKFAFHVEANLPANWEG